MMIAASCVAPASRLSSKGAFWRFVPDEAVSHITNDIA
jgi:hypothetical protein